MDWDNGKPNTIKANLDRTMCHSFSTTLSSKQSKKNKGTIKSLEKNESEKVEINFIWRFEPIRIFMCPFQRDANKLKVNKRQQTRNACWLHYTMEKVNFA